MKRYFSVVMIFFLLAGCSSASATPTADLPPLIVPTPAPSTPLPPTEVLSPSEEAPNETAAPVCISSQPTQADIDRALEFTGKLFERLDWQKSYTVSDGRVSVTWYSDSLAAVAVLEAFVFPCGYEDLDLDVFFSADTWQIVFANYESYQLVADCRTDEGTRLYEFITQEQGFEYDVRYWVANDTDTRVVSMMIVFPLETPEITEEYAYSMFPQLTSCQ